MAASDMEGGVVVIAMGNPLRGDDGVAMRIVEQIEENRETRVITVHQLTPELAIDLRDAVGIVFVDACRGERPGEVRACGLGPWPTTQPFTHSLTPASFLAYLEILHGQRPPAAIVTITGADFGFSERLSPLVLQAMPAALRAIREWTQAFSLSTSNLAEDESSEADCRAHA
ncbi:MAG: hydrogenase maturation protease [Vicinamibacteria bacterium]|jgi:hydrogenase maturation protease|nr:hydrogenase maturation protease [Vicinamibacteria bacterium]